MPLPNSLMSLWRPSIPLVGSSSASKLVDKGFRGSCIRCFHFLLRLAWESRFRLPILYIIISFLCDVQMSIELNMHRERRIVLVEDDVENSEDDSTSEDGSDDLSDYISEDSLILHQDNDAQENAS